MEDIGENATAGMAFDITTAGGGATAVVRISGELDVANIERLERAVAPIIQTQPENLVVDVGRVAFADSSAIALWVSWAGKVGKLELRHPTPLLRRILSSMGLEEKFGVGA
jgi:anti-anti-sigma factor